MKEMRQKGRRGLGGGGRGVERKEIDGKERIRRRKMS